MREGEMSEGEEEGGRGRWRGKERRGVKEIRGMEEGIHLNSRTGQ